MGHSTPLSPGSSDTRRRLTHNPSVTSEPSSHSESPFRSPTPLSREHHALNEHTFIRNTEARLDEFLAQGREVLDNLVDQRTMLKGTQRRLLDAANTLGLSRDVIGWIESRRLAPYIPLSVRCDPLSDLTCHSAHKTCTYFSPVLSLLLSASI
jgi:Golgi SNAP receptor complex protein 2